MNRLCRFAKAEGAVVFVLKPLEAALADNDHIYSVVCCRIRSIFSPKLLSGAWVCDQL